MDYHESLKMCRKILGFSQREVADKMKTTKQLISLVETGYKNARYEANCNYYRLWLLEYVEKNKENLHEGAISIIVPLLKNLGS